MIEEEIPEVNQDVAKLAGEVVAFALMNEIHIESIDQDVLGGVAIYLSNELKNDLPLKTLWVSLLNNGTKTIISLDTARTVSCELNYDTIMEYLFQD